VQKRQSSHQCHFALLGSSQKNLLVKCWRNWYLISDLDDWIAITQMGNQRKMKILVQPNFNPIIFLFFLHNLLYLRKGQSNNTWHPEPSSKCHVNKFWLLKICICMLLEVKSIKYSAFKETFFIHHRSEPIYSHFFKYKISHRKGPKMGQKVSQIIWMASKCKTKHGNLNFFSEISS